MLMFADTETKGEEQAGSESAEAMVVFSWVFMLL